jgi:hypothetical protein
MWLELAKSGGLGVNTRLFVQASMMLDGFESLPRTFTVLVPAGG